MRQELPRPFADQQERPSELCPASPHATLPTLHRGGNGPECQVASVRAVPVSQLPVPAPVRGPVSVPLGQAAATQDLEPHRREWLRLLTKSAGAGHGPAGPLARHVRGPGLRPRKQGKTKQRPSRVAPCKCVDLCPGRVLPPARHDTVARAELQRGDTVMVGPRTFPGCAGL